MINKLILAIFFVYSSFAVSKSDVTYVSQNGFIVTNNISSKVTAEVMWHALINDVDLWWPKDHSWWGEQGKFTITPQAGGCFCEVSGQRSAVHMQISFLDPYKLLRMTGGLGPLQGMGMHGALDWVFETNEETTTITLTYRVSGINPDGFEQLAPIVAKVQGIQLNALKSYVETREGQ